MAEINNASFLAGNTNRFKEAVCINANRIFDSCSGKECLEDLQVYVDEDTQRIINKAAGVTCRRAEVYETGMKVEPVTFNSGLYNMEITYYFRLFFSVTPASISACSEMMGLAYTTQRTILYGGEHGVRTFHFPRRGAHACEPVSGLPMAAVQVAEPMILGASIADRAPCYLEPMRDLPLQVQGAFPNPLQPEPRGADRVLLVTLGLFSIITLEREVQIMIPIYDYSVPEKDCSANGDIAENPCEVFRRIKFPVEEFFPEERPGTRK